MTVTTIAGDIIDSERDGYYQKWSRRTRPP
jgi:hypothetical protein